MNILFHFRTQGIGPEAVHMAGMAGAFEQMGHTVVFSSPTGADPRKTAGISPYATAEQGEWLGVIARHCPAIFFECLEITYNLVAWFRHARLLRRRKIDLVYERHAFFLFSTARLAFRRGIPFVIEVNELAGDTRVREQPHLSRLVKVCDRAVFRRADLIVVVSPYLKRRIEAYGVYGDKILILPNAVRRQDVDTAVDGGSVRKRHHLENAVVIGFVGWFAAWHRIERLVEVFATLNQRQPDVRLMLVGAGDSHTAIVKVAQHRGVLDKVIFAGAVEHAQIPAYVAAMDIGVVPHSNEYRSPIKLFEYMAAGRAVVAPRVEPIEMVVRCGVNGLLFDPESAEGMLAALETLVRDPELRKRLGNQARADVLQRHTWDCNAHAVLGRLFPARNEGRPGAQDYRSGQLP